MSFEQILDKRLLRHAFERASSSYDQSAVLQLPAALLQLCVQRQNPFFNRFKQSITGPLQFIQLALQSFDASRILCLRCLDLLLQARQNLFHALRCKLNRPGFRGGRLV